MKILQITSTVNSGSVGRITEDIGNALIANGHESYIAYGRGNRPSKSKLIKIGDKWDIYKHGFKTMVFDRHGFGSNTATINLISEIEKLNPDAIGFQNIHGYYINIGLLFNYLARSKCPVIWTLHDCWAFTGHCTYFDSVGCEKWKTQCQQCPKTKYYPSSYILDNSKKNFNDKKRLFNFPSNITLVTPSKWLQKLVDQSFLKHKTITIHNGVDLNVFTPKSIPEAFLEKHGLLNIKVVLGVASIWDKRKGLDDFMLLADRLPSDIKVVLIGLSKKQINNLPKELIGIERTENIQELASFYALAEVFINPTYQDNFPTTNIEALACGTPVITYNTGGSPEAIDEETGIVVNKEDIDGLTKAINKVLEKGKEHYIPLCRTRAENFFNKNDRYFDYLNLYTKMLELKNSH